MSEDKKRESNEQDLMTETIDGKLNEDSIILPEMSPSQEDVTEEIEDVKTGDKKEKRKSSKNFSVWVMVNVIMTIVIVFGIDLLQSQSFSDKTGISYVIILYPY